MKPTQWIDKNGTPALRREWERLRSQRKNLDEECNEIRLRAAGRCSLVIGGQNFPIYTGVSRADLQALMKGLTHGSEYCYDDMLADGYLPDGDGVRIGICGEARYEKGRILGIGDVSAVNVRFPHPAPDCGALAELFRRQAESGMLLFSPPGGGKTTVLRGVVRALGSGVGAWRVSVVDERMEFVRSELEGTTVDLLRGYRKAEGISLATRTLSPQVIAVDEIGGEAEAAAMRDCLHAGIPLIAAAHAGSLRELGEKSGLRPVMEDGIFDLAVALRHEGNAVFYRAYRREKGDWTEAESGVLRTALPTAVSAS